MRPVSKDSPLQIGFFSDVYAPQINGVAVSVQLMAQSLRAAGHDVTIFAPRFPGYCDTETGVYRLPAVRYMRQPPIYLAMPGTPRSFLALRRHHFDVLHVHTPLSLGVLAYLSAHFKHLPLIYTYHTAIADYTHYIKGIGQTRLVKQAARRFSAATCNISDHIVVPSAKFEKVLREQNVRRPIHVIPGGIDLDRFYEPPACPGLFRQRLGLAPDTPLLVSVGRLAPEKKLDFLIEAFARLAANRPEAHLVFAGDGSSRLALEKQAAESGYAGRIHFLGMVNRADLPDLLHDADLFLSASTTETQCLAMVEAIASGLPVVAVLDPAFEGILADGVNGWVTPREVEPFSAAVGELLGNYPARQAFGRASVELSRKFSMEAQAASLVGLYRDAVGMVL